MNYRKTTDKEAVLEAIWENPAPLFGFDFLPPRGNKRSSKVGGISDKADRFTLKQLGSGLYVHCNGSQYTSGDVFDFAANYLNLEGNGFKERLAAAGKIYGIEVTLTTAEKARIDRGRLVKGCTEALLEYARTHQEGAAFDYVTKTRGLDYDGHFCELSAASLRYMKQSLTTHKTPFTEEDLEALGLTEGRARWGYNCVIPYFADGHAVGFVLRNIKPDIDPKRRYLDSGSLGRLGYSDRLNSGTPTQGEAAIFVEGQFDAVRLVQAGFTNVIGIGSREIGEELAELLARKRITDVVYIPDKEILPSGELKRADYQAALKKFREAAIDGEPVIKRLFVVDLPTPEGEDLRGRKFDADSWGKDNGAAALKSIVAQKQPAWLYELEHIPDTASREAVQDEVESIYKSLTYPPEKADFKNYITTAAAAPLREKCGITGDALADWDALRQNRVYSTQIAEAAANLNAAAQKGASPEEVLKIAADLNRAASGNAREDWQRQIDKTFEDALAEAAQQPDAMKTGWVLGSKNKDGNFFRYGNISFTPGDVSIICAPTSHGKTTFLIQAALNLLQAEENADKVFLYISSEENERQLFERAFNTYLTIPTTEDGTERAGLPCFKRGWRKAAIKAALRSRAEDDMPDFAGLQTRIDEALTAYGKDVAPRLKLIHTEASAESITANVSYFVNQYRARGVEVGAIFYDYIQLLTTDTPSYSRHDELKAICKALKDCAAGIDCPLIVAAQLNRDTLKTGTGAGIDNITLANIGEAADIERIAHDVYLLWQIARTPLVDFQKDGAIDNTTGEKTINGSNLKERSRRIFVNERGAYKLAEGFVYLEQMKARDGRAGGWGLFPYDGEAGHIGTDNAIDNTKGKQQQLWQK